MVCGDQPDQRATERGRTVTTGERTDPYLGFRFHVELDGLIVAGFSEVSGLSVELETETYEEGGVNSFTHVLPTRLSYPNITLERGLTDSTELFMWMNEAKRGAPTRKNGRVLLRDSTGKEVRGWHFRDGYPVSWEGPELGADGGTVAVERIEIAHNGLDDYPI